MQWLSQLVFSLRYKIKFVLIIIILIITIQNNYFIIINNGYNHNNYNEIENPFKLWKINFFI